MLLEVDFIVSTKWYNIVSSQCDQLCEIKIFVGHIITCTFCKKLWVSFSVTVHQNVDIFEKLVYFVSK